MVQIFAVGVTGWVGSAAAHAIATAHPEYQWTVLLRSKSKSEQVKKYLPENTRFAIGDFQSHDIISAEAAAADIVFNWGSSDDEALNNALIDGLKKKKSTGYLIHTSGTGLLTHEDIKSDSYGTDNPKVYNDWEGLGEVLSFPEDAPHMHVDKVVLNLSREAPHIKTMIVCPPLIYGANNVDGSHERSAARQYVTDILTHGKGFAVGEGKSRWNTVHVNDLAAFFLVVTEQAVKGGGTATWGPEAYYFVENGEIVWGEFAKAVSHAAFEKGLISTPDVDNLSVDDAKKIDPFSVYVWGLNSRSKAVRAQKTLSWKPKMPGLMEDTLNNWRFKAGEAHLFG